MPVFNDDLDFQCEELIKSSDGSVEWREFWDERCTDRCKSIWGKYLSLEERRKIADIQTKIDTLEEHAKISNEDYWETRRSYYSESSELLHQAFLRKIEEECPKSKYDVIDEFDKKNYTNEGCDSGWAGRSRALCIPKKWKKN